MDIAYHIVLIVHFTGTELTYCAMSLLQEVKLYRTAREREQ